MRAQIKADHVPETVWNFGGDSIIVKVFIVMNVVGCFLFQDPVYVRTSIEESSVLKEHWLATLAGNAWDWFNLLGTSPAFGF